MIKSKRLPHGAIRVTDSDGKVSVQVPMTKGRALIAARSILGPDATIRRTSIVYIGILSSTTGFDLCGHGTTFEEALAGAAKSPQAITWSDREIDESNALGIIKDSIKGLLKKISVQRFTEFINNIEARSAKQQGDKVKNAEYFELWKEGREEEYQAALERTKLRAAQSPEVAAAELLQAKVDAKHRRVLEYAGILQQ